MTKPNPKVSNQRVSNQKASNQRINNFRDEERGRKGKEAPRDAIEREVQRRLTDRLVAAGVRQGEISLQVLFMLPPGFVRAYQDLFEASLAEDSSSKPGAGGKAASQPKKVPSNAQDRMRLTPGTEGSVRGAVGVGAKRYRTYWAIRSEEQLKRKGSVDRKLMRLAEEIRKDLGKRDASSDKGQESQESQPKAAQSIGSDCPNCGKDLWKVFQVVGLELGHCPFCGHGISVNTAGL